MRTRPRIPAIVLAALLELVAGGASAQPVPAGDEHVLADSSAGALLSDLAAHPTGGYLVAWRRYARSAGESDGVAVRRIAADGAPLPGTRAVATFAWDATGAGLSVDVDPSGATLGVWPQGGFYHGLRATRVDRLAPTRVVAVADGADIPQPALAAAGANRFLVASTGDRSDSTAVHGRWLDAFGAPLGPGFDVSLTANAWRPAVAGRPDGRAVVAWSTSAGPRPYAQVRAYAPDGSPAGAPISLPLPPDGEVASDVAVAATPDGWVAVYAQRRSAGGLVSDQAIVAVPLAPSGAAAGPIHVAGVDNRVDQLEVAVGPHGVGLVVWTDRPFDGGGNLRAALIDVRQGSASPLVTLNDAESDAIGPRVAAGTDGRFLVAWGGEGRVRGRIVGACGNGVVDGGEACEDGNVRAGDCCSPTCTIEPVAGTCWQLASASVLRFSATLPTRVGPASCAARCRTTGATTLILLDDGTYRWPQGVAPCTDGGQLVVPDETGRWRRRGTRVHLAPENAAAMRDAVRACTGARLGPTHATLRLHGDARLDGGLTTRVQRPGRPPVTVRTQSRLVGHVLGTAAVTPPAFAARVKACPSEVRLRCTLQ